jgi:hypothetical protein
MKNQSFILLAFLTAVMVVACNRKSGKAGQPGDTSAGTKPNQEQSTTPAKEEAWQVAGYDKTPCFGKCPVYSVKFYSDGKVTWHGKMNVERMGWHESKVGQEVLKKITDMAFAKGFFDLEKEYPVEQRVADLPATITYVRIGEREKKVRNFMSAPENLAVFEKFLEDIIAGLTWTPAGQ